MATGDTGVGLAGEDLDRLRALFEIREAQRSGVLSVVADDVTTHVRFDKGAPVDAIEEGTAGEPLGRLLVRTHVLTRAQHAAVIDTMASALGGDKERKFGEVALAQGVLTKERLDAALTDQVRWRIVRALQREAATWSFGEGAGKLAADVRHELSLEAIVLDAARWYRPEQRRSLVSSVTQKYVTLRPDPREVGKRFSMTDEEVTALEAFDGTATALDLVGIEPTAAGVDVSALLVALLAAGALELSDMPRPGSGLYELGLKTAGRNHSRPPSQFPKPNDRVGRTLARLRRLRAAELPASRPEERKPKNEREARVLAEQWFQHGLAHLRSNRLAEAVPLLRRAFGLMPKNLEYELYAMWVEVRVHGTEPNPTQLASLRNIAVAAVRQDPNFAFAYYVLGQITLKEGSESMAKHHFAHALRLDPDAIDAERHVRVLKRREARSRVPQVRRSRPPPLGSGAPIARVALKKASLDTIQKPALPEAARPSSPDLAEGDRASVALYAKVQKTLEMPSDLPTESGSPRAEGATGVEGSAEPKERSNGASRRPPPPKAIVELELDPDPESGLTKTAAPIASPPSPRARSTDKSPLPDGPSSLTALTALTGVARPADERASPAPVARPAARPNRSGLYAGAIMTLGVLVAGFAMLGLRGRTQATVDPRPSTSTSVRPTVAASLPSATGTGSSTATPTASATPTPTTSATPTPTPTTSATPTPTPTASAIASAAATPSAALAKPQAGGEGVVRLPAWASQRRVYVDGKLVGNGLPKLVVPCGAREVQIGSSGAPKKLDVPCGGEVAW